MKRLNLIHLPALLAAALCLTAPAEGAQPVTTSLQVPLAGTVFVPLSDGSFDSVALSGRVHVVTQVPAQPNDPCRIHVNLDQVAGVGSVTKLEYIATGANRVNLPAVPTDPMNLGFDLRAVGIPPDPITPPNPVVPLDIALQLTFNPDTGVLASVSIESMSVPVP
ncbi:MAG TPA: hypothetical protein VNL14_08755 [Candidatus Acidoferrales bacterium]|nr:hypothetical protein [Candidatus Acidoferrales bacterium]